MRNVLVCLLIAWGASALFKDQAGIVDWSVANVGPYSDVYFQQQDRSKRLFVVSEESGVVAAINSRTSKIEWRQVLPEGEGIDLFEVNEEAKGMLIVGDDGHQIRVFAPAHGGQIWEEELPADSVVVDGVITTGKKGSSGVVVLLFADRLEGRNLAKGTPEWTVPLHGGGAAEGQSVLYANDKAVYAVLATDTGVSVVEMKGEISSGHALSGIGGRPDFLDVTSNGQIVVVRGNAVYTGSVTDEVCTVTQLESLARGVGAPVALNVFDAPGLFAVEVSGDDTLVLRVGHGDVTLVHHFTDGEAVSAAEFGADVYVVGVDVEEKDAEVTLLLVSGGKTTKTSRAPALTLGTTGEAVEVFFSAVAANSTGVLLRVLVVAADGSATLLNANTGQTIWTRHEQLGDVDAVQFVDMPAGELNLEDVHRSLGIHVEGEAPASGGIPIVSAFLKRVTFQIKELTHLAGNFASLVSGEEEGEAPVERDVYGFRQILLAVTESGVTALHSEGGRVLWKRHFGDAVPSSLHLFVTRPVTHVSPEITVIGDSVQDGKTVVYTLDPVTGAPHGHKTLPFDTTQAFQLPSDDEDDSVLALVDSRIGLHVLPDTKEAAAAVREEAARGSLFFYRREGNNGFVGYSVAAKGDVVSVAPMWSFRVPDSEHIVDVATPNSEERVESPARVISEDRVVYKYLNPNVLVVGTEVKSEGHATMTGKPAEATVHVYVIDTITGAVLYHAFHRKASGPLHVFLAENTVVYQYWSMREDRYEIGVVDLYEAPHSSHVAGNATFSSFTAPQPTVQRQTFLFPTRIVASAVTVTARGIAMKQILFGLASGGVVALDRAFLDARRPKPGTPPNEKEMLPPYSPHLPLPVTSYINYHIEVAKVRGVVSSAADLESASLVAAFGLDFFFTRLTPSGSFDTLDQDFQYGALVITMVALPVATIVAKQIADRRALARRWA